MHVFKMAKNDEKCRLFSFPKTGPLPRPGGEPTGAACGALRSAGGGGGGDYAAEDGVCNPRLKQIPCPVHSLEVSDLGSTRDDKMIKLHTPVPAWAWVLIGNHFSENNH